MSKTGRSYPIYKTPEEMQAKIDKYFKSCEGKVLKDASGKVVFDKYGLPVIIGAKPLLVTGLALALGFKSRQALLNYQAKSKKFDEIISAAKLRIENYAEMRLFDREGSRGAQFNLRNNYGWKDAPEKDAEDSNSDDALRLLIEGLKDE